MNALRDTGAARLLTANFRNMRLICDLTVSGEILSIRAMFLLVKPWLINARISISRAVSLSPTGLLSRADLSS